MRRELAIAVHLDGETTIEAAFFQAGAVREDDAFRSAPALVGVQSITQ
jgi:hypothetical protein